MKSDDPDRFQYIEDEKEQHHDTDVLHKDQIYTRFDCGVSTGPCAHIRSLFEALLLGRHHKRDLYGADDGMASMAHTVSVNKEAVADMNTFQFN